MTLRALLCASTISFASLVAVCFGQIVTYDKSQAQLLHDVTVVSNRVFVVSQRLDSVSGQVLKAQADITSISSGATTANGALLVVSQRVDSISQQVLKAQGDVMSVSGLAVVVSGQVLKAQSDASSVSVRVDKVIADHAATSGQVVVIRSGADAVSGRVDSISGQVLKAQSDGGVVSTRVDKVVADHAATSQKVDAVVARGLGPVMDAGAVATNATVTIVDADSADQVLQARVAGDIRYRMRHLVSGRMLVGGAGAVESYLVLDPTNANTLLVYRQPMPGFYAPATIDVHSVVSTSLWVKGTATVDAIALGTNPPTSDWPVTGTPQAQFDAVSGQVVKIRADLSSVSQAVLAVAVHGGASVTVTTNAPGDFTVDVAAFPSAQSPWTNLVDGGNFALTNVQNVRSRGVVTATNNGMTSEFFSVKIPQGFGGIELGGVYTDRWPTATGAGTTNAGEINVAGPQSGSYTSATTFVEGHLTGIRQRLLELAAATVAVYTNLFHGPGTTGAVVGAASATGAFLRDDGMFSRDGSSLTNVTGLSDTLATITQAWDFVEISDGAGVLTTNVLFGAGQANNLIHRISLTNWVPPEARAVELYGYTLNTGTLAFVYFHSGANTNIASMAAGSTDAQKWGFATGVVPCGTNAMIAYKTLSTNWAANTFYWTIKGYYRDRVTTVVGNSVGGTPSTGSIPTAVDGTGAVVWKKRIAFEATLATQLNISAGGAFVRVLPTTVNHNDGGCYNNVSGEFTPTVPGNYRWSVQVDHEGVTTAVNSVASVQVWRGTAASSNRIAQGMTPGAQTTRAYATINRVTYLPATGEWYYFTTACAVGTSYVPVTAESYPSWFGAALER